MFIKQQMIKPMKITNFLITLFCITLVGCLGDEAPETPITSNPSPDPVNCSNEAPNVSNLVNYQIIYDECIQWDGDTGSVDVKYQSDKSELTGIGFRIHYDNLSMKFVSASNVFSKDLIYSPETSINDTEDFDQDSSSNAYLNTAWASVNGDWPGTENTTLLTLNFEKLVDGNNNYHLNYSAISNTTGYQFNPNASEEADGDAGADADTDATEGDEADGNTDADSNLDAGSAESPVNIPELTANTQHVYVSSSTKSEDGTQETLVITYNADDPTTTGLGLKIHFDSLALSASDISTLVTNDLLVNPVVESDNSDSDGDANTDQYIAFGWAATFGEWPGSVPADLASITFDIAQGATGSSVINFMSSSNAAGFAFAGQNHTLILR